ncbi:hypothetical protein [Halobaculum limi]|uniref:hypothetical protein n=1 Tax=Halobaculum limi TaxID=3031916 RepID=UPI002406523A|nr:hypothetical protein [Halobaculum sp. YSMS11]
MSEERPTLLAALKRPAEASYGTRRERLASASIVGVATGALGAMATYALRLQLMAPEWATTTAMGLCVLVSGVLVKLLCEQLRTSLQALVVSTVVGAVLAFATAIAPYYLLDISTLGGFALLPVFRDVITFLVFGQVPLQITGYLLAIVYDGATS